MQQNNENEMLESKFVLSLLKTSGMFHQFSLFCLIQCVVLITMLSQMTGCGETKTTGRDKRLHNVITAWPNFGITTKKFGRALYSFRCGPYFLWNCLFAATVPTDSAVFVATLPVEKK